MGSGAPFQSLKHSSMGSITFPSEIATKTLSNTSPGDPTFSPVRNSVPSSFLTNRYKGYDLHSLILFAMEALPFSTESLAISTSLGRTAFSSSSNLTIFWKMDVPASFSFSPLMIAWSTSTCLSFCISGYAELQGSSMFSSRCRRSMAWQRATR
ncbi:phenylalanine ammonia-lyase-like [Iris pallida]|uniref:Phenylalanine ammonia-lyase-like n=1 Tax=Iris pallida TaxID=29817 RepID=A0AAX6FSP6_IRIPA|nr:phenylalanine ammonia-lyase-like [Iris pallida]KAJ6853902.1 phenylalanine ammonia-lyase-like [Iris pallida]